MKTINEGDIVRLRIFRKKREVGESEKWLKKDKIKLFKDYQVDSVYSYDTLGISYDTLGIDGTLYKHYVDNFKIVKRRKNK